MSDLRPCPRCSRHADASERACPFCHAELAGAVPGKVRLVSRRELTRAAIFGAAALLVGACGSSSAPAEDPDHSSGGESEGDATDLSHASDDGSRRADGAGEESEAEAEARQIREAEAQRRAMEEEQRRLMEDQRHRHRECTPEGICPPYGAPPMPDALV